MLLQTSLVPLSDQAFSNVGSAVTNFIVGQCMCLEEAHIECIKRHSLKAAQRLQGAAMLWKSWVMLPEVPSHVTCAIKVMV